MAEEHTIGIQESMTLNKEEKIDQDVTDDQRQQARMKTESRIQGKELDLLGPSGSSSGLLGLATSDTDNENQNVQGPLALPATPQLNVIRSTRFQDDAGSNIKLYHTRGLQRGALVIFSYSEFTTGEEHRDVASDNDMLMDLFRQIGFKLILPYENKTKPQTLEIIKNLKLEGFESVFFVMSSHGYGREGMWDTDIRCTDGGFVSSHDVVDLFSSVNHPTLDGVPKVFIFQACRGVKSLPELRGLQSDVSNFTEASEARGAVAARALRRSYSDILIAHSTLPGYVSIRIDGDNKGSWYKQSLCSVFAEHAHEHHVLDLFRLVDEDMQHRCPGTTTTVESWGFNRNLYLHPGLAEDANGNPKPIQ